MTFERVIVLTFPGVSKDAWPDEFDLPVVEPLSSCTVSLVASLDNHTFHADREQAVRAGMLQAITYQDEEFKGLVAEVQASRPHAAGYAVITVQGPAELDMSQTHRDMGDVVVGFELAEKDNYREMTRDVCAAVSTALAALAHPARVEKIIDSVYFFDERGRVYYVSNVRFGNVSAALSWARPKVDRFIELCRGAAKGKMLNRSVRLLASTLAPEMDRFQRFVTVWIALELLVNKLYPQFRDQFMTETTAHACMTADTVERVRRDAATLIEKFTLIGSYLRPSEVEDDANAFSSAKRSRDLLMHTGDGADDTLPLELTTKLLVDYISEFLCPTSLSSTL
jgi:hypothetical protein